MSLYPNYAQGKNTPFLFIQENQPEYIACQRSHSINYIQIKCSDFEAIIKCFYNTNNTRNTFININNILSFLKEIELHQSVP